MSKSNPTSAKRPSPNVLSPFLLALFACAVILTGIIMAVFGHKFGYQRGFNASQSNINAHGINAELTSQEVKELTRKVDSLNQSLNTAKQERDISLNNLGVMRKKLEDIEVVNLQLQQVNDFYADALVKQKGLPLQVMGAKIEPLPENAFEYRFDVAMLAADGKSHQLRPQLILLDETSLVEVPLQPLTYDIKGISRIRGRFIMPTGFQPRQVKLILAANNEQVEQIYNWRLSSPVDKMPMSLSEVPKTDQRPVTED